MKGKIVCILVCMLMLLSVIGTLSSAIPSPKSDDTKSGNKAYSHKVLGEFGTATTCVPCKYAHTALKYLYAGGYHPFYYISYVHNKNNHSKYRIKNELGLQFDPTIFWDGDYTKNIGGGEIEVLMEYYNQSIISCGNRNVKDIDILLNVEWHGAVNPDPEDGATNVPVEEVLNWTVSEMGIDVEVKNNEGSTYNGHLHVQVTEVESTWWNDKFGYPYTFEFKDYAFNEDITISAGGTWSDSVDWDGCDHNDKDNPPRYFDHITQDNIMVIATVFDEDNNDYVDETEGFKTGNDTDPKRFDVFFGETNPPPQIVWNTSSLSYPPHDLLNWTTTYYWKVNVWDASGNVTPGKIWSFTTRGNTAPYEPVPVKPQNNSENATIDTNITWNCIDPEGDDLLYDVFFGEWAPGEKPPLVSQNQTERTYDPTPIGKNLEFDRKYHWRIVAWEEYGETSAGPIWVFTTEKNKPPHPAHDPIPPDGANNVPGNAILSWNGSDPNSGDSLRYDVFFSINYPPILVSKNQTGTTHDPYGSTGDMPLFEEYYWRIVTWDRDGLHTRGPDWSFHTGINPPPTDPDITGPSRGVPDVVYDFTFVSTDPDNNTIRYVVDWGDGTTKKTGFYASGEEVTLNHSWTSEKEYIIKARAYDIYNESSDWSDHKINIPRSKTVNFNINLLDWLFERFPYMFQILKFLLG